VTHRLFSLPCSPDPDLVSRIVDGERVALDGIASGRETVRQPEPFRRTLLARHRSLSESLVRRNRRHRAGSPVCRPSLIRPDQIRAGRRWKSTAVGAVKGLPLRWGLHAEFRSVQPGTRVVQSVGRPARRMISRMMRSSYTGIVLLVRFP
jgi:hypothetical protein